jgi:hypothetical protein
MARRLQCCRQQAVPGQCVLKELHKQYSGMKQSMASSDLPLTTHCMPGIVRPTIVSHAVCIQLHTR